MVASVNVTCCYCHTYVHPIQKKVICSSCGTVYHHNCWEISRGCSAIDCSYQASPYNIKLSNNPTTVNTLPVFKKALAEEEVKLAGFGRRLLAVLLDIVFWQVSLLLVIKAISRLNWATVHANPFVTAVIIGFGLYPIYYIIALALKGQTIGKYLANVRVVRSDGRDMSLIQTVTRCLFQVFISPVSLGISYLRVIWHPQGKTWHDSLSDTIVIVE